MTRSAGRWWLLSIATLFCLSCKGLAQEQFDNVINIPPDTLPEVIEGDTQINLHDGGHIPDNFSVNGGANQNIEINMDGGFIGRDFDVFSATANVSGGRINHVDVRESTISVSGGSIGILESRSGVIHVSGGFITELSAYYHDDVAITGGVIGPDQFSTSDLYSRRGKVAIAGGEVAGQVYLTESRLSMTDGTVGSVRVDRESQMLVEGGSIGNETLNQGSVQITGGRIGSDFSSPGTLNVTGGQIGERFRAGGAISIAGGEIGNDAIADGYLNLFAGAVGQGLNVKGGHVNVFGGTIGDRFHATGGVTRLKGGRIGDSSRVEMDGKFVLFGGELGNGFRASGDSVLAIHGGETQGDLFADSRVVISGGNWGARLVAAAGSDVLIVGTEFQLDGVDVAGLAGPGDSLVLTAREGMSLTGLLRDGAAIELVLNANEDAVSDVIPSDSTLRLMFANDCDHSFDGVCDENDLNELVGALGSDVTTFDSNSNGTVDIDDIGLWLEDYGNHTIGRPIFLGDTNFDGSVDSIDLGEIGLHWQFRDGSRGWRDGDFNGDTIVDALDLNLVGINWQRGTRHIVPEPTAWSLAWAALFFLRRQG